MSVAPPQHLGTRGHVLAPHVRPPLPTLKRRVPPATPPSPHCWESAFQAYYIELCEYVLRFVGSAEAAQDLVQDLFLRLWDSRGPRDATRLTRPYLFVAARNSALKYLRHQHVADAWVERASRQPPPVPETPEELYLAEELESAV